jgi:hypothetical protein
MKSKAKKMAPAKECLATEITVKSTKLANFAYHCLADLMENSLSYTNLDLDAVEEAEVLVKIQKALAKKVSIILLRIEYEKEEETKKEFEWVEKKGA